MIKVRMSRKYYVWIFTLIFLAWLSGLCLFSALEWGEIQGEFGLEPSPYLGVLLKLHGLFAFCFLITLGFFLGTHVQTTWKIKKNRLSGYGFLTLQILIVITGYLLYYFGWWFLRYIHFALGFSLPFFISFHARRLIKKLIRKRNKLTLETD